jgi:hypothetical protein
MAIVTHLIHGISIFGMIYSGTVTITALTAITAPTAERRRDARAVLKLMLRVRHQD